MLSKEHLETFDERYIRLSIPSFTVDAPDNDKIWCLFWWMIGQNWGFNHRYYFYWLDYKALTTLTAGVANEEVIPVWNAKYGKWLRMGIYNQPQSFIEFPQTDWEFVEWECRDPRLQRIWIHLYNQVWTGRDPRQDIFETEKPYLSGLRHLHVDHGWWMTDAAFNWRNGKRVPRPEGYVPHYLRKGGRKETHKPYFEGKIKQPNGDTNI
jgi:hypothetical protein